MTENKMRRIANMFNMNLGDEFKVKSSSQEEPYIARFTEGGIFYMLKTGYMCEWIYSENLLVSLLTGRAEIVME